jgi:hypothetical protein
MERGRTAFSKPIYSFHGGRLFMLAEAGGLEELLQFSPLSAVGTLQSHM